MTFVQQFVSQTAFHVASRKELWGAEYTQQKAFMGRRGRKISFLFVFLREREKAEERQKERERKNLRQAQCSVWSLTQGSIS